MSYSPNQLTYEDACEIRRIYQDEGLRYIDIAHIYDVPLARIGNIIRNQTFNDPTYSPPDTNKRLSDLMRTKRSKRYWSTRKPRLFSVEAVKEMRKMYEAGYEMTAIAKKFSANYRSVYKICKLETYKDV